MEDRTKKTAACASPKEDLVEISDKFWQLDSTLSAIEKQKNTALTRQMARIKKTLLKLRALYRRDAIQAIVLTK